MSKIALEGNSLGTGTFTIAAPNSNSSPTLTLPTSSGTIVVTGGAQTIEFAAGTAAAPSITFTGDTNTGIFSPAADTIAFAEGGAEAMRITSTGRVAINRTTTDYVLEVQGGDGQGIRFTDSDNSVQSFLGAYTSVGITGTLSNHPTTLWTNNAERMRITSGGEVYIAGTTDQGAYNLQCNGTGVWGAGAYVNGSDARIKEDVTPITSGLDVVEKLNPVTYRYKEDWSKDQSTQTGFIAQELLVALEGQNYINGVVQQGGSEGYYSVAYQNIIPILTKAIQELKTITDAQTTRIEALEAEVAAMKGQ